jgi:hypothetical protein
MMTTWQSDVQHLLPMCHVVSVRITFSASAGLLPYFSKLRCIYRSYWQRQNAFSLDYAENGYKYYHLHTAVIKRNTILSATWHLNRRDRRRDCCWHMHKGSIMRLQRLCFHCGASQHEQYIVATITFNCYWLVSTTLLHIYRCYILAWWRIEEQNLNCSCGHMKEKLTRKTTTITIDTPVRIRTGTPHKL